MEPEPDPIPLPLHAAPSAVPETRFGRWFIGTRIWSRHVLARALDDLERLIPERRPRYAVVVDLGCGHGHSFRELEDRFRPQRLVGIEVDTQLIEASRATARRAGLRVEVLHGSDVSLPLPDASADVLLCHQTFHHLVQQATALREFHRVLRPGGLLLFSESTRRYIHSWIIRLLFRHPMEVQRSAPEYLAMVRDAGFHVPDAQVSHPFPWWSRPDLGLAERWFGIRPAADREETQINLVGLRLPG